MMIPPATWLPLGGTAPTSLTATRIALHRAAQWPARFARSYVPARADDSHTSLSWLPGPDLLCTQSADSGSGTLSIGINLASHALVAVDGDAPWQELTLNGVTEADVVQWMGEILTSRGFDSAILNHHLPYDVPPEPGVFDPIAAQELSAYFGNLAGLLGEVAATQKGASPVRCWPHHFDVATLITLGPGDFETAPSVGVGLSPGDDAIPQPYVYVTPWPLEGIENLGPGRPPGTWQNTPFKGFVAQGEALIACADQAGEVRAFIDNAVEQCKSAVLAGK